MKTIIKNIEIINRNQRIVKDVLINNHRIEKIENQIDERARAHEIDGTGLILIPGIIDDQVHFREPGLTHKADIASESRAAVAGGVTSFMEMPNTTPTTTTQAHLSSKYSIASQNAFCNYSFFMGVTNENYDEVMKTNLHNVCGLKIFMGSSTGNMLVDDPQILEKIFANTPMLIATHCEDENIIKNNLEDFKNKFGDKLTALHHPLIRNEEGCFLSSSKAIELAKKHNTRLHILHISTEDEIKLFRNDIPLSEKKITAEVCVHHLYFSSDDYEKNGNLIKCNPAIKDPKHKKALFDALLDDHMDIIATDHAPHTFEEKSTNYLNAPSGLPLVQHSINIMLDFYHKGHITLEKIVEKMCHAPAQCFKIEDRGYIDEGYYADLVILDVNKEWMVSKENIHYKCQWSPFENISFKGQVLHTFVNGETVYKDGIFTQGRGMRLSFDRK